MYRRGPRWVGVLLALATLAVPAHAAPPIRLHPANPHVFLFRGKPTVLVGSSEHYGALINLDFDTARYLDTVAADGLNVVRVFAGTYVEKQGDFGIAANTLAPAAFRLLVPWARSTEPGYAGGGHKFDLSRWDEGYFARLRAFVAAASQRGIVVEIALFSSVYQGLAGSPLHGANNVNGTDADASRINTLHNGALLAFQEALVRKIVAELRAFDNVYYEIQNEPWADLPQMVDVVSEYLTPAEMKQEWMFWKNRVDLAGPASLAWQSRIAEVIAEAEKDGPDRHLVSQDVANFSFPLTSVDPNVGVLNFHYASPQAVAANWHFGRVIGFNETGFAGTADATYRKQAWRFVLSGGAVFDHLDYSFTVGHEDGTAQNAAPGGGSAALRRQLGILRAFVHEIDLTRAAPAPALVRAAPGVHTYPLSAAPGAYAVYLEGKGPCALRLDLPVGRYRAQWLDPRTGARTEAGSFTHTGGERTFVSPAFDEDLALAIESSGTGLAGGSPHAEPPWPQGARHPPGRRASCPR